jgi:SAM-dependent methyltransferase
MTLTFLDLKDIAESGQITSGGLNASGGIELVNPTSPEKILEIGRLAGMAADSLRPADRLRPADKVRPTGKTLIDFGCGYAEPLVLWAEAFGIAGIGVDIRPKAVERARRKIEQRGLAGRLEVVQGKGAEYAFEPGSFDFSACIGASFVWDDLPQALQALKRAIRPEGRIILGEPYWLKDAVPPDLAQAQPDIHSETWLLHAFRQAGLETGYVIHSNHDDWDRYEASNWRSLLRWIESNPAHPDLPQVIEHLHESQDEYFRYGREYFGWALYLLQPDRNSK